METDETSAYDGNGTSTESDSSGDDTDDILNTFSGIEPHTFTIITTYGCTAACKQCCFKCSPDIRVRLSLQTIESAIKEVYESFSGLRLVVFTGGEPFMLKDDLIEAISMVSDRGLASRVVTNGYWGSSPKAAKRRVQQLVEAGLHEINFSTGDEHQEWVSWERVRNAAIAASERNIRTVITVESNANSNFTHNHAIDDPIIREFIDNDPSGEMLTVQGHLWMSFTENESIEHHENRLDHQANLADGCKNIVNNLVLTPNQDVSACCGLTFEDIPQMKLGKFGEKPIKNMYENQFDDFLKSWIHMDGPQQILNFARSKNPDLPSARDLGVIHMCEACAYIHNTDEIRQTLKDNFVERVPDVLFRLKLRKTWSEQTLIDR